jgi:mono/diheme cytochrome c family protein
MNRKAALVFPVALLGSGFITVNGQQVTAPQVFTAAQAEAGKAAYENSCGRCHTYSLRGRKGDEGELPPVSSLPAPFLKFIGTHEVPPLMGEHFIKGYGHSTVADLFTLFRGAADSTPVSELHMSDDTLVNITAYILQMNGAKPGNQPLFSKLGAVLNSLVE